MKRRVFIRNMSLGALSLGVSSSYAARSNGLGSDKSSIGVQLYTVRDLMEKSPKDTLKAVAALGYKEVEPAGYHQGLFYGMKPNEFKKLLDDLGLKATSGHNIYNEKDFEQAVADAATIGQQFYTLPIPTIPVKSGTDFLHSMDNATEDNWKDMALLMNRLGKVAGSAGLRLCYHNHNFEFKRFDTGKSGYDILLEYTDAKLANFEMDLYWVIMAGKQPEDYFRKYPGRFKLWHVKDMELGSDRHFTEVGNGRIDFKKLFSMAKMAGLEHFYVEQDKTYGRAPLESLKISFTNLNKILS